MKQSTFLRVALVAVVLTHVASLAGDDGDRVLTIDHYVPVQSAVPAIKGQTAHVYLREKTQAATALRGASLADRVVLFVHGAGTPGHVAFDVPVEGYSWMAHVARAGFDVFALDFTGYGRSTRPEPMNNPCNLSPDQQQSLVPALLAAPCPTVYAHQLTTIASDWHDLNAAVDYIRRLRRVDRVSLVAWSLGGPRAGGFTLQHPEKVHRLVLLSPAFNPSARNEPPAHPSSGVPMTKQSRDDFVSNWDRQVGCADQYDPLVRDAVWSDMLRSDPVGTTWGTGVRRAPTVTSWGWNATAAAKLQTPTLAVAPVHDKQVLPDRVREFHAALGARQKVLADLNCASHNAMWEKTRTLLFDASVEWLSRGTLTGASEGVVRLGY